MSLRDISAAIENTGDLALVKPVVVDRFSAGYVYASGRANGLAALATPQQLAIAAGVKPANRSAPTAPPAALTAAPGGKAPTEAEAARAARRVKNEPY